MTDQRRSSTIKQIAGDNAEDRALAYLLRQGLQLRTRNFRCKGGEIDLIMNERETLVFIEVRKRSSMRYGGAAASVTPAPGFIRFTTTSPMKSAAVVTISK